MYKEKNEKVKELFELNGEFIFIQRNEEKGEGDLVCTLDMNVPLCVPIYVFRELTKLSNEEIYNQAKEKLTKSEFDDRYYSDEKVSNQLRVARNIKNLLSKEEFRIFSKEQIKFIAENVGDGYRLDVQRDFERLDKTAVESYKSWNCYHNYNTRCFDLETLEEIKEIQEIKNYSYGSEEKAIDEFVNLNMNKPYLFIQEQENGNDDRTYGWEIDTYTKYYIYIPQDCFFSSIDEDILEIIKKFNL